jgi:UDP-glucose 4-epimerase
MKENYWFKSAIVTGGAGFIGSHICDELIANGVSVTCIDNLANGKLENIMHLQSSPLFSFYERDVTKYEEVEPLFKGIEVVFHEACSKNTVCMTNPRLDLLVNAMGTYNVLEAARVNNVKRFIHASSGSVFGNPLYLPEDEGHPLNPVSFYGTSKLAGEKYCFTFASLYGMKVTALRYFHVYGPRQDDSDKGGVVSIFTRKLIHGESPIIYGDGTQLRSFTYVKDVVKANLLCAQKEEAINQVYIVASGLKITIGELAEKIIKAFGADSISPVFQEWRSGDIKVFDIDNSKIKKLGVSFERTFDEGLGETITWMKEYYGNK